MSAPSSVTVPTRGGGQQVVTVTTSLSEMANAVDAVELAYEARHSNWPAFRRDLLALLEVWVGATPDSPSLMAGVIHRAHRTRYMERLTELVDPSQ